MSRLSIAQAARPLAPQRGQALTEAILVLPVLMGLWWAVGLGGDLQHSGMQASGVSRLQAFRAAANSDPLAPDRLRVAVASSPVASASNVRPFGQVERLQGRYEPGAGSRQPAARLLRVQWMADERGLLRATARREVVDRLGLGRDDSLASLASLAITRFTVLASGAAHSSDDTQAQARIGLSQAGWQSAASRSVRAGASLAAAMQRVDRPWRRAALDLDWLMRWQSVVPGRYVARRAR